MEVAHEAVGLANAVVAWLGGVFDVGDMPSVFACELEGRDTFAFLLSFEVHVVVFHGLAPWSCERWGSGGEESWCASFLLNHHVPEVVSWHPVDVSIDGGVAPVEEESRLGERGKVCISVGIVHAVVSFFATVPEGEIDEVTASVSVGPQVVWVPYGLRCPHAVDGAPVFIHTFCFWVAEDGRALAEVEGARLPMDEVLAG